MTVELDHLTTKQCGVVADVAAMAAAGGPDVVDAVVDRLSDVVPWAAMSLSAYNPLTSRHHCVSSAGYSNDILAYLDDAYLTIDPAYRWIVSTGRTYFSWETTEFDYSKTVSARRYWTPAGYTGGSTSYITDRYGQYAGNLHTSTEDPRWPPRGALALIEALSPVLATLLDPWRDIRRLLTTQPNGTCSVVIDKFGRTHTFPEVWCCGQNPAETPLHALVRKVLLLRHSGPMARMLRGQMPRSCWHLDGDVTHRIDFVPARASWLVLHRPETIPFEMTRRQLVVCSLAALGLTNRQIAAELFLADGTVRRHIEDILHRVDVPNRAALASFVLSQGLLSLGHLVELQHG